jgi:hypothetical protein
MRQEGRLALSHWAAHAGELKKGEGQERGETRDIRMQIRWRRALVVMPMGGGTVLING